MVGKLSCLILVLSTKCYHFLVVAGKYVCDLLTNMDGKFMLKLIHMHAATKCHMLKETFSSIIIRFMEKRLSKKFFLTKSVMIIKRQQ